MGSLQKSKKYLKLKSGTARRLSMKQVCRSFDLLHVAIAAVSQLRRFATFDDGQGKVAKAAGLKVIEFAAT